jgi:hypothetical protein
MTAASPAACYAPCKGRDLGVAEQLKALEQLVSFVAAGIERCRRDRQDWDDYGLPHAVKALDEGHDLRVPAGHGHDHADVQDIGRWDARCLRSPQSRHPW